MRHLILLLLLAVATSCTETPQKATHDVYVCGYTGQKSAKNAALWKNGEIIPLEAALHSSEATAMKIIGDDIYCVGTAVLSDSKIKSAVYWKNGELHPLSDGKSDAEGLDIAIIDGIVYCVGRQSSGIKYSRNIVNVAISSSTAYHTKAMIWSSDGKSRALTDGKKSACINAIDVDSQGGVIIAGYDEGYIKSTSWSSDFYRYARAWDMSGKVLFSKKQEKNVSTIEAISSYGGDIIYAGLYDDTPDSAGHYGVYWSGGLRFSVPDNFGQISDVKQTANGLYCCGLRKSYNPSSSYGNLWANGVLHSYREDGAVAINALDVDGDDIYCTGLLANNRVAIWHNHKLMDWGYGEGLDIVIKPITVE